jgi:hypothetical protein
MIMILKGLRMAWIVIVISLLYELDDTTVCKLSASLNR